jgi:hypothetical protein
MTDHQEVEYTVLLVVPGFGAERENAEAIVESALDWLNNNKEEPGFRFAPPVSAHLEVVPDADEARASIAADEGVAMVLLHDLPDDERDELVRDCAARHIAACYTVDAPRRAGPPKGPLQVVFRSRPAGEVPAHRLAAETLTAPVGEDEETGARVGEVIAVLALGVMGHHWEKNPVRWGPFGKGQAGDIQDDRV